MYDTRTAVVESLAPDDSARRTATLPDAPNGDVDCQLGSVERFTD